MMYTKHTKPFTLGLICKTWLFVIHTWMDNKLLLNFKDSTDICLHYFSIGIQLSVYFTYQHSIPIANSTLLGSNHKNYHNNEIL